MEKYPLWGLWAVCGGIFIASFNKRVAQKLRIFFLLHFGTSNFLISLSGKSKKVMVMISGPSGRDHDFQNQFFLILFGVVSAGR